jgi:hypothetical protein
LAHPVRTSDLVRTFEAADPHLQFDAIVAATAEVLRGDRYVGRLDLGDIAAVANAEDVRLPPTDDVHQFLDLLDTLAARGD